MIDDHNKGCKDNAVLWSEVGRLLDIPSLFRGRGYRIQQEASFSTPATLPKCEEGFNFFVFLKSNLQQALEIGSSCYLLRKTSSA